VLKSLEQLFNYISSVKSEYSKLVNLYSRCTSSADCRKLSEDCIKTLDQLNERIEANVFPYYEGYSLVLSQNVRVTFETYYDEVTQIYSKYSQPELGTTILSRIQSDFSKSTIKVISSMYSFSKQYCPMK
jgi:hypothetical protein